VIYQHPLAYLLGLQGMALLQAYAGDHDEAFTRARIDEVRTLLDTMDRLGDGGTAEPLTTAAAVYEEWAPTYDSPGNQLIDIEGPLVREILGQLPTGVALDAACGTARHGAYLASLGHTVIGVDVSVEMLARAREKVPDGTFHQGTLDELPLPDRAVDLVVCSLALTHIPDLRPVRPRRPGGHLVPAPVRCRGRQRGLPGQAGRHHLALPARRLTDSIGVGLGRSAVLQKLRPTVHKPLPSVGMWR
jgi:SAM-dependent methyltransferase